MLVPVIEEGRARARSLRLLAMCAPAWCHAWGSAKRDARGVARGGRQKGMRLGVARGGLAKRMVSVGSVTRCRWVKNRTNYCQPEAPLSLGQECDQLGQNALPRSRWVKRAVKGQPAGEGSARRGRPALIGSRMTRKGSERLLVEAVVAAGNSSPSSLVSVGSRVTRKVEPLWLGQE